MLPPDSIFNDPASAWCDYVRGVVKLMIWHVWDLHRRGWTEIERRLDERVDIVRKTTLFDGVRPTHGWMSVRQSVAGMIRTHAGKSELLENAGWEYLRPYIEPTVPAAMQSLAATRARPFGCWRCEPYRAQPATLALHFVNAYEPRSPFHACRAELVATLQSLLQDAVSLHPDADRVMCGSWLNQFLPFQLLFPHTWTDSFAPVENYWATWGWWGQYMTHQVSFHARRGAAFRQRRQHPYTCSNAGCRITDALSHLATLG